MAQSLKVFLDDERITPDGWVRAYWPEDVIELLITGQVSELSLDHDLGDDVHGTGYSVAMARGAGNRKRLRSAEVY